MQCCICGNTNLTKFLSLGHQPPSDAFLHPEDLEKPEIFYPLDLYFCEKCFLVQLGFIVDPEILFREYVYTSGMNNSLKKNFANLVDKVVEKFNLKNGDLAVDIGSNDGTLLDNYRQHGIKTLGIDPSSATKIAIEKGIDTLVDFFCEPTAALAKQKYGEAKIITATNVFAHVPDLDSFMMGIDKLLAPDGVFISESGYLLDLIEKIQYDSIYHEHLRYYSCLSLASLFEKFGFEIFDVERIETHNGSLRVYAARSGQKPKSKAVEELLAREKASGLDNLKTLQNFSDQVISHRLELQSLLIELKKEGKRIVGIGAPAKGNTLLNSCHLNSEVIECLAEKSDLKIGLYSPGMHIPVIDEEKIYNEPIDYALILSWNIADELIKKIKETGFKGHFIIPFPKPVIL